MVNIHKVKTSLSTVNALIRRAIRNGCTYKGLEERRKKLEKMIAEFEQDATLKNQLCFSYNTIEQ